MTGTCWQIVPAPTPLAGRKRGSRLSEDLEKRWGSRSNGEGFSQGHCPRVLGWERAWGGGGGGPGPLWAPPGSQAKLHKEASLLL